MHIDKPSKSVQCIRVSYTNCYLLECENGYLLIDAGFPGEYCSFIKKLSSMNIDISDIQYLLLTHSHDDHAGCAAEIKSNSGAKIITHQKGVPFLRNGESGNPFLKKGQSEKGAFLNACAKYFILISSKFSSRTWTYNPVAITGDDIIVDDDNHEVLKRIGIDGKILYTPGHTEDSISVILSDGSVFLGDLAMNPLYFMICRNRYRPIWLEDIKKVYHSWTTLRNNGAKIVYPAHGKPFGIEKLIFPMGE
jgi:glyoxylase-like metal-dependent hydrolase (beta-lactamase superfamily II)